MMQKYLIRLSLFIAGFIYCFNCKAQVTIPWSSTINLTFGYGNTNPGPPLQSGYSEFTYTTAACPGQYEYTIVNSTTCESGLGLNSDAGHTFMGISPIEIDSGYMMIASYSASRTPKLLFADTVRNLCGNVSYFFSAAIRKLYGSCLDPNFTMIATTTSGQLIKSWQTGNIGGSPDSFALYPGIWPPPPPPFVQMPYYYGFFFDLPPGVSEIVMKIIANPSDAFSGCSTVFAIDNIILTPAGPNLSIEIPGQQGGWIAGSCFQGNTPLILNGTTGPGNLRFGKTVFSSPNFTNPAFQWQQSVDNGYNWIDIPGETAINLSYHFATSDTFLVRLRASEAGNIGNINCSIISNVIKVQVDGIPTQFEFSSNSPVCTDADVIFSLSGGASYITTGPNGFYDNIAFPHIYHPQLRDSGWYYATIKTYGGCAVTDSTYVQVTGPSISVSENQSICYGKAVQLSASGGIKYAWSPADGLSDINIANPFASPITTTRYSIKITDDKGCSASGFVTVQLRDSILKAMIEGPQFACPSDIIILKDSSIGAINSWYWNFDDGQVAGVKDPAPRPFLTLNNILKDYRVKLIVTDTAGCTDTAVQIITAVPNCYIDVPNAFTPNNDGINDYLYPLNAYKARNLHFMVFNRAGQLVFETRERNFKWDGTLKGEPQSPGTYVWMLDYTDMENKKILLKGAAVLLR